MTLSEEARALLENGEADRRSGRTANRGALAQREAEAEERRNTGFIVPIEVGVTVWTDVTKLRGVDDEIAQQDGAMKGIALDSYAYRDEDGHYAVGWRVLNPFTLRSIKRFAWWHECDLDLAKTERTAPHLLAQHWRKLHRLLAEGTDLPSQQEATIAGDAQRLLRVLFTEGGRK